MTRVKTKILLLTALLGPALAAADEVRLGNLHVIHPTARASLPGQNSGVIYMTIENKGASAESLLSLSSPAASGAAIHSMTMQGTTMKMRELERLPLAPVAKVAMTADSGYHIMLTGLKQPLKAGDQIPLTLTFEKAGKLEVSVHVGPNQAQRTPATMPSMPEHSH